MENNLEEVYQSAIKFLLPLNSQDTYVTIVQEAMRLTHAKYGSIFLEVHGDMKRVYSSYPGLYNVTPRKEGMTKKVYETGKPSMRSRKDSMAVHADFKKISIGSDISIPLPYKGKTIGVLSVLSYPDELFTQQHVRLLELFAPLASITIRKAHLTEELAQALEYRDLFISLASHELRTPITTIFLYTNALEKAAKEGKPVSVETIAKLKKEEIRIKKLIDEFLLIDNIKKGNRPFTMQPYNLKEVVKRAVDIYTSNDKKNPLVYKDMIHAEKVILTGDFDRLLEAFQNVLNNASKYSPEGEPISLTIKQEKETISILVKDSGIGISDEDLPYIFDRFYKGNKSKEGMGLGLYLVKDAIERHNGTIVIESELHKGTNITIRLPTESEIIHDAKRK